jgi:hypothetical protein
VSTLKVLKDSVVNALLEHAKSDVSKYQLDEAWVETLFPERSLFANTKLADLPNDLLLVPDGDEKHDLENSKRLYSALSGLTLTQASDPRLWTYLTHVKYWGYMRKRWPIKDAATDKVIGSVISRYFLVGDKARALTRNGLARLWWAGYTCHSSTTTGNEFAYAKALFATQDVFASLMERAFSKNRKIIQPVLSVLTKEMEKGVPFDDRDKVRDLGKHLVLLGGAMVLDILDPVTIEKIVEKFIVELDVEIASKQTEVESN